MDHWLLWFKSKVVLSLLGALLFGGLGATVAVIPFSSSPSSATTPTHTRTGTTADEEDTSVAAVAAADTPTTPARPTQPPAHTATPTSGPGGGQGLALHGAVVSVDTVAGTFVLRQVNGTLTTVVVTGQTTFQGAAQSLNGLHVGWPVNVRGSFQTDGTFTAALVNTFLDN